MIWKRGISLSLSVSLSWEEPPRSKKKFALRFEEMPSASRRQKEIACQKIAWRKDRKKNLTKSQRVHDNVRQVNSILLITTGSRILTISEFREPLVMGFENGERENQRTAGSCYFKHIKGSMGLVKGPAKNQWFCGQWFQFFDKLRTMVNYLSIFSEPQLWTLRTGF